MARSKSEKYVLFCTFLFLFSGGLFLTFLVLYDFLSGNTAPLPAPPENWAGAISCPEDYCATNLLTGEKRCPAPQTSLSVNPSFEVCNPAFSCTSPFTPYAQNADGSTNLFGLCPEGIACNCLRNPTCPEYLVSAFDVVAGDPLSPSSRSRVVLQQRNFYQSGREIFEHPPLSFSDPSNTFCTLPLEWLNDSSPGCQFNSDFSNLSELQACFDIGNRQSNGNPCLNNTGNPCLSGVLSFLPSQGSAANFMDNFTSLYKSTPVGCVRGTVCQCGEVSVWDQYQGQNLCFPFPQSTS